MRVSIPVCLVLALNLPACAGADPVTPGGSAAGAGGSATVAGTAGTGTTSTTPSGGSTSTGPAPVGSAGAFVKPAATGGGDDGGLFDASMAVPFDPNAAGGMAATGGSGGSGGGISNDGVTVTSKISGNVNGTAAFTQHGMDVNVVVKLTKCPGGTLGIHVNDGDACDGANIRGRAVGRQARQHRRRWHDHVQQQQRASMTYTRLGSRPHFGVERR